MFKSSPRSIFDLWSKNLSFKCLWKNGSALDKQEVLTDLVLQNEEQIPIPNNYLPDVLAITKGERRGSVAEEEALDA